MLRRWLGVRPGRGATPSSSEDEVVTTDPLAAIEPAGRHQVYSVSRSVMLPRVVLKNCGNVQPPVAGKLANGDSAGGSCTLGGGINPIFSDHLNCASLTHKQSPFKISPTSLQHENETNPSTQSSRSASTSTPITTNKPASSGYGSHGGSSDDPTYLDTVAVLEQNANFVKSILVAVKNNKSRKSIGSLSSSAAGTLTLTTIPEGQVDFTIPRPVWPKKDTKRTQENLYDSLIDESVLLYTTLSYVPEDNKNLDKKKQVLGHDSLDAKKDPKRVQENLYDSLIDESVLLYTSLSYVPEDNNNLSKEKQVSADDILKELSDTINLAVEGNLAMSPEQILKVINDRLCTGLEVLQRSTEEDMRKLSVNLSNSEQLNTVIRAFSNSSSSGLSSETSEKSSGMDAEDIYQVPSGCSSSGFSGGSSPRTAHPVFIHEDLSSMPNGMRNALIYGTLCRGTSSSPSASPRSSASSANERLLGSGESKGNVVVATATRGNKRLLVAGPDEKPSIWEMYYGAGVIEGDVRLKGKNADASYFPAGRPEADFTLDVPRSELLTRRMRAAKKWRFRCRIFTSFLGLVFFLLSLMVVSLVLTRGKRMFGSMV